MSISFAFVGADADEPFFKKTLDTVAETFPGIVLVGESVDVDVDEPSITIRWSIGACGEDFMLPGSAGVHGSDACGLPAIPLRFYVDSDDEPTATYDSSHIPFNRDTGHRRSIQNLVQFDSDHVLDVHEARLYPFDTYMLSSTIRAANADNQTVPIRKIATIDITSSFDIFTTDLESYSNSEDGKQEQASRDIDLYVRRPNEARLFTLLLFAVSWVLTHVTIGHVLLARRVSSLRSLLPHLISSGAILIAIPQLRASMPDAPGFDGVLIDCIGYFPQMVIVGLSTVTLLLLLVVHEFDRMRTNASASAHAHAYSRSSRAMWPPPYGPAASFVRPERPPSLLSHFPRPPPSPTANSTSTEIMQWEMHRLMKQLKGQYVFPPVQPTHRLKQPDASKPSHRRVKTMSKIMEAGEISHWSDTD
ncbi:unnamed protein product [Cyclocybe aegerita]|uniref:Uncharacterized protein n=1 Tax=Cyclocybe aegerita TaxID=1973307 RepID=A0A8S0WNH5_CYCAE|nr:unnamed protein product [Cyclocybe aegerita]